jgi:YVTN family beta-propeller protein
MRLPNLGLPARVVAVALLLASTASFTVGRADASVVRLAATGSARSGGRTGGTAREVPGTAAAPAPAGGPSRVITAYVVNGGNGTVTPINTSTNKPGRAIRLVPAGDDHEALSSIGITPGGRTAYVLTVGELGDLTPISTATNKPGEPIATLALPQVIAITPNGKTVYLAEGEVVLPISTATNKPGQQIPVAGVANTIVITPDGKTAYALSSGGVAAVTPINTATNKAGKPIRLDGSGFAMAITPNGKTLYVANWDQDTVTPIDTATNKAGRPIKVGHLPGIIAITPNGKTAYVGNVDSQTVTPINTATNKAGRAIRVPVTMAPDTTGPANIVFTPAGDTAYVVGPPDVVTPINTATDKAGRPIKVGRLPNCLAITANGRTLYVGNGDSNTVTPINTATNRPGRPIKVGLGPVAIAITP